MAPPSTPNPPIALQLLLVVLAMSNIVFLASAAANPLVSLGLTLALGLGVGVLFRRREAWRLTGWRTAVGCGALAFAICLLGGQGHVFFTTDDWPVRDAVLADLTHGSWPVIYQHDGAAWVLRAPLGFYLLPALAGRGFGLQAAHLALLLQDTVMLGAILALLLQDARGAWRRAVLVGVFFAFSGWDILGQLWAWRVQQAHGLQLGFPLHIERWAVEMEYSSFLTDLFWAPNHALPAFAFAAAYLCWKTGRCSAPALAAFSALCLLWSPLAVMGSAPFVLLALTRDLHRGVLRFPDLAGAAVAGAAVCPMALYLTLDSGSVVHGFTMGEQNFWPVLAIFMGLEVAPLLYLLFQRDRREAVVVNGELMVICAMLLTIPFYRIGVSNDFMMRASIVPLALAAFEVARRVVQRIETRCWAPLATAAVVLVLGAVTPVLQVARSFYYRATPPATATVPYAWTHSMYGRDRMGTYLAPVQTLDGYSWLFRSAADAPRLNPAMR